MKLSRPMLVASAAAVSLLAAGTACAADITGAGATFPAPVYAKWAGAAKSAVGVTLNYQALGSGAGQNQIINHTVDFGASDAPMAPAKLTANHLLQFPTVMGAVVPIVNLPHVQPNGLKLTGDVLAQIFDGDITAWNDPAIAALNPYVILVLLVVPFGFAEFAKVYGLILIADGHYRIGMTMFLGAYVVSILVCERIFHAGKSSLMTIGWFKTIYDWLMAIRDRVLAWLRETRIWRASVGLKRSLRSGWRRINDRWRVLLGPQPKGMLERP